jgi:hypothetical protein
MNQIGIVCLAHQRVSLTVVRILEDSLARLIGHWSDDPDFDIRRLRE